MRVYIEVCFKYVSVNSLDWVKFVIFEFGVSVLDDEDEKVV